MTLHSCLLLLSGTTSAILRTGLVELPGEIDQEGSTGGVVNRQFANAVEDGIGLVGVEDVNATHIKGQLSETAEVEVALDAEFDIQAVGDDAVVVVVALVGPLGSSVQTETLRQFDVVLPDKREVRTGQRQDRSVCRRRLVVLEYREGVPHRMPLADGGWWASPRD